MSPNPIGAVLRTVPAAPLAAAPGHGIHAHRVIFIDLARALAVVMMVYGHTASALLAPAHRAGWWYDAWLFQRGLTSSLFLLLSGFAFSIATSRHWPAHTQLSPAFWKRTRRFGFLLLLGYVLHLPVHLPDLGAMTGIQRQAFLSVDVLQLLGATFIVVQLLVLAVRTRRAFTMASLCGAAALILLTPAIWGVPWTRMVPPWLAAYVTATTGSQFPLFPFAASLLAGAGLGQIYSHWGASHLAMFANRVLLAPGLALTALALLIDRLPFALFGTGPYAFMPVQFTLRTGVALILLAALAHASRLLDRLPQIFGAVAQESLLIYVVHLCLVYGSVWSPGLLQAYGTTLDPRSTVFVIVPLIGAMIALAWYWNWCKHARPRAARWITLGVAASLFLLLLV